MNERYRRIQRIDSTQFGRIDIAEDQLSGQKCVIKTIYKSSGSIRIRQWRMEVRVLSEIHSTFTSKLLDVFEDDNSYSLVQTYIPGDNMNLWMRQSYRKRRKLRKKLMMEWMDAIQDVHKIGFLYIDIKPSNCIILDQHLFLIDFNSCIEIGQSQVVSASRENIESYLMDNRKKEIETDLLGITKMMKRLFPFHISFRFYPFLIRKKLIRSIKQLQTWFSWGFRIRRVLSIMIIMYLSVFFLIHSFVQTNNPLEDYKKNPTSQTFYHAYQYSKLHSNVYQSLYEWLTGNKMDKKLWKDAKISKTLLEDALVLKDRELVEYIVLQIPKSTQKKIPFEMIKANFFIHKKVKESMIQSCILEYKKAQDGQKLIQLVQLLLENHFILSMKTTKQLSDAMETSWHQLNPFQGKQYLEYSLFLLSEGNHHLLITKKMAEHFKDDTEFKEMYSLWKEGQ